MSCVESIRRQRTRRVARMHTGLFDVLHDRADHDLLAVADRIDVDLDRLIEKVIEQHRRRIRHDECVAQIARQIGLVVHDFHRATAEHVRRPHHHRESRSRRPLRCRPRRSRPCGSPAAADPTFVDHLLEALPIFGPIDRIGAGADDRHAFRLQRVDELQRRLAAELHDDAGRSLHFDDREHVFERHRFEIQTDPTCRSPSIPFPDCS